jgi:hypothetical protein
MRNIEIRMFDQRVALISCRARTKPGGVCGEGGNVRKIPLASMGANAIFATIVFRSIRVWGVGSAEGKV